MNSNTMNDLVVGGLDQTLPLGKQQTDLLGRVDSIVEDAVAQKNPDIAGDALVYMLNVSRVSGLVLAKTLYTLKFQWKNFNRRDSFEGYIEDYCGVRKDTRERYIRVWEMLVSEDVPREYAEKIKLHPIKSLVPIATLWKQGYEVDSQQWLKLANAPDVATVNKIIREIKGVEPRKGSLQIVMEPDGSLFAWKNDIRYFVGHLNVDDDTVAVQEAIARLTGDGRVMGKE